ncbi:MAG: DegV family protein [Asgard group archaeon]|nr:DegV family protein [Asgard group archaeon]
MKDFKIVTDSSCDLTKNELKAMNVDFIPLTVIIDGKKYKQHVDISTEELYHKLIHEECEVKTAASSPGEVMKVFERVSNETDNIICLSIGADLSAMFQVIKMVAKKFFGHKNISIIDTKSVSLAHALLVEEAVKMKKKGIGFEVIIDKLQYYANYAHALPLLDTLEYVYRGGRIKLYQKLLGDLLRIKPLLDISQSNAIIDSKVRNHKQAMIHFKMCGIQLMDFLKINKLYVGYTDNRSYAEDVHDFLVENTQTNTEIAIKQLGPVVGTHGGPNVVGYGFIGEYESSMFRDLGKASATLSKLQKSTTQKSK